MIYLYLGILLATLALYIRLRTNLFSSKQSKINECAEPVLESNEVSTAIIQPDNYENDKWKELYDPHVDFVNKQCTNLTDFIINDKINAFDLKKLCELNRIHLQIREGWFPLVLHLIKELDANGWNKKLTTIKEKWAKLEFHITADNHPQLKQIISTYSKQSQYVCEKCGERGEIRSSAGWDYVACRTHYVEGRRKITANSKGFVYRNIPYNWEDIEDARFEVLDYYNHYKHLVIDLKTKHIQESNWTDEQLYLSYFMIGFGSFVQHMPHHFENLDRAYAKRFQDPEFCEICGYKAVYNGLCECCENVDWETYITKRKYDDKHHHISYYQMNWKNDEGDELEKEQQNFVKNPQHQLLYTPEEYEEFLTYDKYD